jgi:hypothetical protein
MDRYRVEEAVMTVPLETDFDLSGDAVAESLKQVLADSLAEAMAAGGDPARIRVLRAGSSVTVRVLLCDPLPGGEEVCESVYFFCPECLVPGCREHAPRA